MCLPHVTTIGVYQSPKVTITQLCIPLRQVPSHTTTQYNVFIGDFNLNWLNKTNRVPLYNLFLTENILQAIGIFVYHWQENSCKPHLYKFARISGTITY